MAILYSCCQILVLCWKQYNMGMLQRVDHLILPKRLDEKEAFVSENYFLYGN